jgi:hypothetical protein
MPKKIRPLNQLKQLLVKCEAQMAGIEKARTKAGARKMQALAPKRRIRKA